MISIIICSRKPAITAELQQNIAETIGCDYELVVIDNSHNVYSIFQAYNEGVRRSKGEVLCFMHDDILFHSPNWGKTVEETFNNIHQLGAIGIAGAHLIADAAAPLWAFQKITTHKIYSPTNPQGTCAIEYGKNAGDNGYWTGFQQYSQGKPLAQVANIDGVWMCIRASLFKTLRWDEERYTGFHCYDADISMQINLSGYDIMVTNEVLIEHASPGVIDNKYFVAAKVWYNKWKDCLPVVRGVTLTQRQLLILTYYTIDACERQKELVEYE